MEFSRLAGGISANILARLEERRRELTAEGRAVINLSIGTPDLGPDRHVMEALAQACLNPASYRYAVTDFPELTDAVIGWYRRRFGVALERQQVTSLYGSQEGMAHVAFPLCDPGDTVLLPDPCYPVFAFGPKMAGAALHYLPLREEQGYLMDLEAVPVTVAHRAKLIIVSYPNNPTTAVADEDFYERLVRFAKKYDVAVLHDNAYCELRLDGKPGGSFLAVKGAAEVGIEFNSLSKSYNLTGMRMSFALGNKEIIRELRKLRSQIDYGPFPAVQKAVVAALEGPQEILERNRAAYIQRRNVLAAGLRRIGWQVPEGGSTMFTWYPVPGGDDEGFCLDLLEQAGVIGVPGSSFGEMGRGYVRFALVQPPEVLEQAVRRIEESGLLRR